MQFGSAARTAPTALEWLGMSLPARPYHIFPAVCNLINADGEVLSLMLEPAEMNPLALELRCQDLNLDLSTHIQVTSKVQYEGTQLNVGDLLIDLDTHDLWNPWPDWGSVRAKVHETQSILDEIAANLLSDHSPDSLAVFLNPLAFESTPPVVGWMKSAIDPIKMLLDGLERLNSSVLLDGARGLAGLGLGLTPSGDDFIIGVMHALWMQLSKDHALSHCSEMLTVATPRTNALSANYLKAAARGEASESWHTIVSAIAQNDVTLLNSPVEKLMDLGHTSGQDALAGFLLASRYLLRS